MARVGIIGAGPAGLMAAEAAAAAGASVTVFEAQPTAGRKLLMAGKSGLNITHSEDLERFVARYGAARPRLQSALDAFDGPAVRDWCAGLGVETFVGSSGRVFPKAMKASPLLRAWLSRLGSAGVTLRTRARWTGWSGEHLLIETPEGEERHAFDAVVLALGGASWPRLGSDGAWTAHVGEAGIGIAPFRPANCGFEVAWSPVFIERFAGAPVKAVVAESDAGSSAGEFVISRAGVEGSLVYTHSAALRDRLEADGSAVLYLDLVPGRAVERLAQDFARQKPGTSFANRLRKGAGWRASRRPRARADARGGGAAARPACRGAQAPAAHPVADPPDGGGHFRGGWGRVRRPRSDPHGALKARPLHRRGNARLGSADRGISPHRLSCHRAAGRAGCCPVCAGTRAGGLT